MRLFISPRDMERVILIPRSPSLLPGANTEAALNHLTPHLGEAGTYLPVHDIHSHLPLLPDHEVGTSRYLKAPDLSICTSNPRQKAGNQHLNTGAPVQKRDTLNSSREVNGHCIVDLHIDTADAYLECYQCLLGARPIPQRHPSRSPRPWCVTLQAMCKYTKWHSLRRTLSFGWSLRI